MLQEESGCSVYVPKESPVGVQFKEVTLSGSEAQITKCEKMINDLITGVATPGALKPGDIRRTVELPLDKVGKVIGKKGSMFRELQATFPGCSIEIQQEKDMTPGQTFRACNVGGPQHLILGLVKKIEGILAGDSADFVPTPGHPTLPNPMIPTAAPLVPVYAAMHSNTPSSLVVQFPRSTVDQLRSYNGHYLQAIMYETGCHIAITNADPLNPQHDLTLSGLPAQIAACRTAITTRFSVAPSPGIHPSHSAAVGAVAVAQQTAAAHAAAAAALYPQMQIPMQQPVLPVGVVPQTPEQLYHAQYLAYYGVPPPAVTMTPASSATVAAALHPAQAYPQGT